MVLYSTCKPACEYFGFAYLRGCFLKNVAEHGQVPKRRFFLKNQAVSSFQQWIIFYFGKFNFHSIIQKEGQLFTKYKQNRSCFAFCLLYKTFSTVITLDWCRVKMQIQLRHEFLLFSSFFLQIQKSKLTLDQKLTLTKKVYIPEKQD